MEYKIHSAEPYDRICQKDHDKVCHRWVIVGPILQIHHDNAIIILFFLFSDYPHEVKLQKYIAHAGICSRRKAEAYIEQWLVTVNGEKAHIGQIIDPEKDQIHVDNALIRESESLVYYVFHKPRDIVTTCLSGKEGEKGILDVVSFPERVFPIGRLDKETTWLIIMTNDGRLSNYLMHPRYEHEKEYVVEVYGKIDDEALEKMRRGVKIELKDNGTRKKIVRRIGGKDTVITRKYTTAPCEIVRLSSSKFSITLKEGKNRQIRRMVAAVDYDVKRLKRVRIENIFLGELKEGEWRRFTPKEKQFILEKIDSLSQSHLEPEDHLEEEV